MPTIKLGSHSDAFTSVVHALEVEVGLPASNGANYAWLGQLPPLLNEKNGTDIKFVGENHGFNFEYNSPKSAILLGQIKGKYKL